MCDLPEEDAAFLFEQLEQAFDVARSTGGEDEAVVCEAITTALVRRRSRGIDGIFRRIALDRGCKTWLSILVIQLLDDWDLRAFESLLREVAFGQAHPSVRAWAAEYLVASGQARADEIDSLLHDPDHFVRVLVTRGLAELGTPDAIARLAVIARSDEDDRFRSQATNLLLCLQLAPTPGGLA